MVIMFSTFLVSQVTTQVGANVQKSNNNRIIPHTVNIALLLLLLVVLFTIQFTDAAYST